MKIYIYKEEGNDSFQIQVVNVSCECELPMIRLCFILAPIALINYLKFVQIDFTLKCQLIKFVFISFYNFHVLFFMRVNECIMIFPFHYKIGIPQTFLSFRYHLINLRVCHFHY
jgi:hypothetical protein